MSVEFAKERFGRPLESVRSFDEAFQIICLAGRDHGPELLLLWAEDGMLERDPVLFGRVLIEAWSMVEVPEMSLPQALWLKWFERVGFVSDCGDSVPRQPMRLYRGCRERRFFRRMSWTLSVECARWFAARFCGTGTATVLAAIVAPSRILGMTDGREGEREVVIDPRGDLKITVIERGVKSASVTN